MLGETAFGTYATLKTAFDQNAVGRINTFQFSSEVKWGGGFGLKTLVVNVMPPNGAEGHRSGKVWTRPSILTFYSLHCLLLSHYSQIVTSNENFSPRHISIFSNRKVSFRCSVRNNCSFLLCIYLAKQGYETFYSVYRSLNLIGV